MLGMCRKRERCLATISFMLIRSHTRRQTDRQTHTHTHIYIYIYIYRYIYRVSLGARRYPLKNGRLRRWTINLSSTGRVRGYGTAPTRPSGYC